MRFAVFFLIGVMFSGCASVDMTPVRINKADFTVYADVNGVDSGDLFLRAQEWVALSYKSSNDVIQSKNILSGRIVGNGVLTAEIDIGGSSPSFVDYSHSLVIDIKDERARLVISDFVSVESGYPPRYKYLYYPVKASALNLMVSFKDYMENKGMVSANDW